MAKSRFVSQVKCSQMVLDKSNMSISWHKKASDIALEMAAPEMAEWQDYKIFVFLECHIVGRLEVIVIHGFMLHSRACIGDKWWMMIKENMSQETHYVCSCRFTKEVYTHRYNNCICNTGTNFSLPELRRWLRISLWCLPHSVGHMIRLPSPIGQQQSSKSYNIFSSD